MLSNFAWTQQALSADFTSVVMGIDEIFRGQK